MTPEQLATVLAMVQDGVPFKDIAAATGFSDSAISKAARTRGIYRQPRPNMPMGAVKRAYENGMTADQIANQLKVARSTVTKYLRVYGCQLRDGGNQPKVPSERIYMLRIRHRLPWTEIARRVGLKDTTVRTRFLRFQQRLQSSADHAGNLESRTQGDLGTVPLE